MPSIEHSFQKAPTIFAKLRGRNGRTLEYHALVDPAAQFCVLPRVDAYSLGYSDALADANTDYITRPANLMTVLTSSGYINAPHIVIEDVTLGFSSFKRVDFLAYDLPQESHIDVLLGRSLLDRTKMKIDCESKRLILEE
jgi:predicted aspartyl protease